MIDETGSQDNDETDDDDDDDQSEDNDGYKDKVLERSFIEEEQLSDDGVTGVTGVSVKDGYNNIEYDIYNMLNNKTPLNKATNIPETVALDNDDIYVVTEDTSAVDENKNGDEEEEEEDNDEDEDEDDEIIDMTGSIKVLLNKTDDNDDDEGDEEDDEEDDADEDEEEEEEEDDEDGDEEEDDEEGDKAIEEKNADGFNHKNTYIDESDEHDNQDTSNESYNINVTDDDDDSNEDVIIIAKKKLISKPGNKNIKILTNVTSEESDGVSSSDDVSKLLEDRSQYTEVTIGAKKKIKKAKNQRKVKNDTETQSAMSYTSKFEDVLDGQLKDATEYNLQELKKIAKSISVPLSYTLNNKRRYYKKNELYDKIQKHLVK